MQLKTRSQADTAELGGALGGALRAGDTVLITGDLGAGKSVLSRGIARALGVRGPMPSPTFTLMQPYQGRVPVYHYDLYRLSDADEFYAAGLDEYLGAEGVALIEWPMEALEVSEPLIRVHITRGAGDEDRAIRIEGVGMGDRALKSLLSQWEART